MEAWCDIHKAVFVLFAYLLGSIPFGLVLTRMFASKDVRKIGSGNIGATNVFRAAGSIPAALTLAADALKGVVPVYIAGWFVFSSTFQKEVFLCTVAFAAFIGHLYPVFLRFKTGGKGVATAAGCFILLCPWALSAGLLVFILSLRLFGRVSVGSLAACAVIPIAVWAVSCSQAVTYFAAVTAIFIFIRHRDNIKRLREGKEPTFNFRIGPCNGRKNRSIRSKYRSGP